MNMHSFIKSCAILVVCLLLFTGCWDLKDLEDLSIPIAGGYDLDKKDIGGKSKAQLMVSGIVPNFRPDAKENYKFEYTKGKTIGESREERSKTSSDSPIYGMLQVLVFGQDLAKQGLGKVLDINLRYSQIKNSLYLAIADGRAEDVLNIPVKDYDNPGEYILKLIKTAQKNAFIPTVTLHDFSYDIWNSGKNPILPIIEIQNKDRLKINSVAIFKHDKMISKAENEDMRSLVLLRGISSKGFIPFFIDNKDKQCSGSVIVKNSRKVKVKYQQDKLVFDVKVLIKGQVVELYTRQSLLENKDLLKNIEKAVQKELNRDCITFIEKMQHQFKVDCIDISKYALAKWRSQLTNFIDDERFIQNAVINVAVDVKLDKTDEMQ